MALIYGPARSSPPNAILQLGENKSWFTSGPCHLLSAKCDSFQEVCRKCDPLLSRPSAKRTRRSAGHAVNLPFATACANWFRCHRPHDLCTGSEPNFGAKLCHLRRRCWHVPPQSSGTIEIKQRVQNSPIVKSRHQNCPWGQQSWDTDDPSHIPWWLNTSRNI